MIYENFIRVLYIDAGTKQMHIEQREDLKQYLGGVGVASKLLEENMRPDLPPLAPEQPIVFACGALTYVFPVMTKAVAMFVSPHTGELGESYAGGRMATMMFHAGFDAIVIKGRSERPVFLSISTYEVNFRDARAFWGTNNEKNIGRLLRESEPGAGKRSFIRIGPAGEHLVSYASVNVDKYRHFGRLGLGAVLGSKHIKAITVSGGRDIPIKNQKDYMKAYRDIYLKCINTDMMEKYHDIGTPINVLNLNAAGSFPTENLKSGSFEGASKISGEAFSEHNLVRKMACTGCPVGCIHIGQYRREFADHSHEYEAVTVGYDYELIFALGSFLRVGSRDHILEIINAVEDAGLDAMSTGVALGWATEALEKGLIAPGDTIVPLKFGDKGNYIKAILFLSTACNEFYKTLGMGARAASEKYGGKDFAMQIAGNEMPGYHTGYGSLIGAAVGARHSHLCNAGYSIDQSMIAANQSAKTSGQNIKPFDPNDMLDKLEKEEKERCMLNSLVMCLFARKIYDRPTVLSALNTLDWNLTDQDLSDIALRIYKTKLRIKKALGFDLNNIQLPKRFFETASGLGKLDEKTARDMLSAYQKRVAKMIGDAT